MTPPRQSSEGVTAESFIDCSGATPAILDGLKRVEPAGTIVLVGMRTPGRCQSPITNLELNLTGIFRYTGLAHRIKPQPGW